VDHRGALKPRQPVLALLLEKRSQRPDPTLLGARRQLAGANPEHVILEQPVAERGR